MRSLVCDGFLGGIGSVLSFVPQIALMYLFLDFLEESGFMSALAFMTDGLFSKIGLSGRAAFSVLLGYGCTDRLYPRVGGESYSEESGRLSVFCPLQRKTSRLSDAAFLRF